MPAGAPGLSLLRAAERRAVPWKNGGGVTREVAAHPPGSDLAGFEWRLSIAEIGAAGPFSRFEGVERCLAVLEGTLRLAIEGRPALALVPDSPAVAFPGEAVVRAAPDGGPVTDLNLMTRRGRFAGRLTRILPHPPQRIEARAGATLLVALSDLVAHGPAQSFGLTRLDALWLAPGASCVVAASPPASYYRVEILPGGCA
jgi:uncharacterized protein